MSFGDKITASMNLKDAIGEMVTRQEYEVHPTAIFVNSTVMGWITRNKIDKRKVGRWMRRMRRNK